MNAGSSSRVDLRPFSDVASAPMGGVVFRTFLLALSLSGCGGRSPPAAALPTPEIVVVLDVAAAVADPVLEAGPAVAAAPRTGIAAPEGADRPDRQPPD